MGGGGRRGGGGRNLELFDSAGDALPSAVYLPPLAPPQEYR